MLITLAFMRVEIGECKPQNSLSCRARVSQKTHKRDGVLGQTRRALTINHPMPTFRKPQFGALDILVTNKNTEMEKPETRSIPCSYSVCFLLIHASKREKKCWRTQEQFPAPTSTLNSNSEGSNDPFWPPPAIWAHLHTWNKIKSKQEREDKCWNKSKIYWLYLVQNWNKKIKTFIKTFNESYQK